MNEGFHILDHVQILDQERQRRASKKDTEQAGKSSFVWNEIVFNSFKSGYVKQIDFEFYKSLESAVSKRLYRFLDKRFYRRQRLEFDLRTFSCEHIGLSKKYHNGELKRVLAPAIKELEERGFLEASPSDERFVRKSVGEWTIVLGKAGEGTAPRLEQSPLIAALVDRGVTAASARWIVGKHDEAGIREKLGFFDWLVSRNDRRVGENKAGFLYRSITEMFPLPDDYRKTLRISAPKSAPQMPALMERQTAERHQADRAEATKGRQGIDAFWSALPSEEQDRLEGELAKEAPIFLRQRYQEGKKEGGLLFRTVRQAIIDDYVRGLLAGNPPQNARRASE